MRGLGSLMGFAAMMLGVWSHEALGQTGIEDLRPPKTDSGGGGPQFMVIAIALLLVGAVVFVTVFKSKRTHQD